MNAFDTFLLSVTQEAALLFLIGSFAIVLIVAFWIQWRDDQEFQLMVAEGNGETFIPMGRAEA